MTNPLRRLALATILAIALPAWADDAPKPADPAKPPAGSSILNNNPAPQTHSAGVITGKLGKSTDSEVTVKVAQIERKASGYRRGSHLQEVEKDHSYELASDAKIRWHTLPKKTDGASYTDKEYQALREPAGALGYKADSSDLKPGQTVRLYLSKAGRDDKPVVTTIMIMAEAPKHDDSKTDKTKKPN